MDKVLFSLIIFILMPVFCCAESLQVTAQTTLYFEIPSAWQWVKEPPQPLLEEMAEHIGHEAAAKGHAPNKQQLIVAARKRLKSNEVLLYNPDSTAYMTLDLSPLRKGERAPGKESISLSAKYAGQSLQQEEGVSHLQAQNREVQIGGAWYASRYDADYLHHEQKMHFSGIIGFASPYWFFFYYTDYLKDPSDKISAEQIFRSIRIEHK